MTCLEYFEGVSAVHRLDPRARFAAALVLGATAALSRSMPVLAWALVLGALLAAAAGLDARRTFQRLLRLNVFMLFLWTVLPWSMPGRSAGSLLGLPISKEGLRLAAQITLKGNAMVLLFTSLVATIDPPRLGGVLKQFALPDKLVHLFLLVIRYTDVMHQESARLRRAMCARAFRPRFSPHTLRTYGYLVGLLLVRALDRSERVLAAMKCRGFDGRFHAPHREPFRLTDGFFAAAALGQALTWVWLDRL